MLDDFIWDDDVIAYCRGTVPAKGGREWVGAKRVLTIMNINVRQFVTLEFIIEEGVINVYDCNVPKIQEDEFFIHIQPVIELWPKLLKQSGMFERLPEKLLNEAWKFVLKENLPRNETAMACGSYSLAFIEHLLTGTNMMKPETLLCDNSVARMQWRWAVGVIDKVLEP